MNAMHTKQFQMLSDMDLVWQFAVDNYRRGGTNGMPAPFLEYALASTWMDKTFQCMYRIWFDTDRMVGFVFNEAPVTDVYISLSPEYGHLSKEMLDYAELHMPNFYGNQQIVLLKGQQALMDEAIRRGYQMTYAYDKLIFDFENVLSYDLPKGFHFVDPADADPNVHLFYENGGRDVFIPLLR